MWLDLVILTIKSSVLVLLLYENVVKLFVYRKAARQLLKLK